MSIKIAEIINYLETLAPVAYQESYDNSGLIVGDKSLECTGVMVCLDSIEEVIQEAIQTNCNLVVAHHPIVFSGLKSITGKNYIERTLLKAIKNNIAIYAIHTNLDNVKQGVNQVICGKLGLTKTRILEPKYQSLSKFIVYGVAEDIEKIRTAIFSAGAGQIGNYEECSYLMPGEGTFKPMKAANPTIGSVGTREKVSEYRLEALVPNHLVPAVLHAAKNASSYEELAYDIIPLSNKNQDVGSGMFGELKSPMNYTDFLALVKKTFRCGVIRYTKSDKTTIKKVAVCGGSGSFLLNKALGIGADAFITADFKYHQFFDAENRLMITDIGHFESEQFTIDFLAEKLKQKFSTFAVRLTSVNTNPVNYY